MSLYFWLMIGTITGPFLLSFDKKVHFYTHWKALFPALSIVAIAFIVWDQLFTQAGIWGFNPRYLSGIYIMDLPLEEVLFFFFVPYACLFIYEVLIAYFPKIDLTNVGKGLAFGITLSGLVLGSMHMDNWYTSSACILSALLTIGIFFVQRVKWYGSFAFTFLVSLIPFLLVNGVLTGSFTPEPIVWYNPEHIMGPRIFSIPVEDVFYNYSMLLPIVWLYERWRPRYDFSSATE